MFNTGKSIFLCSFPLYICILFDGPGHLYVLYIHRPCGMCILQELYKKSKVYSNSTTGSIGRRRVFETQVNFNLLQVVIATSIVLWVYRNEESDTYLLSCLNVPVASVADMTKATVAIFPINFVCFFLSIGLFRHFKRKEEG